MKTYNVKMKTNKVATNIVGEKTVQVEANTAKEALEKANNLYGGCMWEVTNPKINVWEAK